MLVIAGLLPALAFLWILYRMDRHREPPGLVFRFFLVGAVVVLPAGIAERTLLDLYSLTPDPQQGFIYTMISAFFVAGVVEEGLKALCFLRLVNQKPFFEEPYDGIVYAGAIGLGFAAVENVLYVTSSGIDTAFVRAFTAVPAHAVFAVIMGSRFARARFFGASRWPAFAIPALLHGLYDTFAMSQGYLWNLLLAFYLMVIVAYAMHELRIERKSVPHYRRS